MKRTCALLLAVFFLCLAFPSPALAQSGTSQPPLTPVAKLVDANGYVIFSDKLVEDAFRSALGVPEGPIKRTLLNNLSGSRELIISSPSPVTLDLSVLQLCANLRLLTLEMVTPSNLGAVTSLKSLTYFEATKIQIADLRFLVGIGGLSDVWIGECPCEDISAVVDMPSLINFSINSHVPDITPLYSCKKLVGVSVGKLTDEQVNTLLDKIGGKLDSLGLDDCAITDDTLERISQMRLRYIMLDKAPVHSIAPLWNIKTLEVINLFNMRLDTLEGIQNITNLQQVNLLGNTGIRDYGPLFRTANLRVLKISFCKTPDLEGIQNLKNLQELTFEKLYTVVDLAPAFALANLKKLSLTNLKVGGIDGIGGLRSLTDLTLNQISGIDDYTPLSGLKNLKSVHTDVPDQIPAGLPVG